MVAAAVVGFFVFFSRALRYNSRVTGKFSPVRRFLHKLLQQHFHSLFSNYLCAARENKTQNDNKLFDRNNKKAAVFIFLRLLSVSLLRWMSIRSPSRVIDFQPVTFCSDICDVHTGLLFLVAPPRPLSPPTPPHVHALNYNRGA